MVYGELAAGRAIWQVAFPVEVLTTCAAQVPMAVPFSEKATVPPSGVGETLTV
jgi:hypothetical protein